MKLTNQAMGAIMLALQKCLMEQSDITKIIGEFDFQLDENEQLLVINPPVVEAETGNVLEDAFDDETIVTAGSD